ncbi:prenyltransferase/squalene oxidase repeat-containing protein [Desulfosarcina cetonica]|uniref:prenyltransferase/squalene oxidase repeat-containing protein n=1 Tax=Desulfosarcina cetonica TaxID=90730 RepID=UPI0006CFBEE6|nr:hypothetical protein [Desulfosarcina cetonica]
MLDKMRQDSIRFVLSLWDEERGGFRFAHGNEVTLMGTAYALHALEFLGHLNQVTDADKKKMISFIMSGCQGDGTFRDMLFKEEMIATQEHDVEYFEGETTCFCQQALDILGHISPSRKFPKKVLSKKKLLSEFDSYDWKNPHLNSNRVMFWLAQFVFEIERHSRNELIPLVDAALDWIDDNQSKLTGLWKGNLPVSLSAAMAGTFHFTFFYFYRHRPLLFLNRIIDSCIKLQRDDGLFSRNQDVGQTCLDYDALDLLAKASLVSDYRQDILDNVFQKAREPLKELLNSDGGFANCKFRTLKNQKQTFVAKYHTAGDLFVRYFGKQLVLNMV